MANRRSSRQDAGELGKDTGDRMNDIPKDNVVDLSKAKKGSKSGGGGGDDTGGSTKNTYYAVTPVIQVEEADRLIRLRYMTESGYLDILGVLNQIQVHNKRRYTLAINVATLSVILSLGLLVMVVGFLA